MQICRGINLISILAPRFFFYVRLSNPRGFAADSIDRVMVDNRCEAVVGNNINTQQVRGGSGSAAT